MQRTPTALPHSPNSLNGAPELPLTIGPNGNRLVGAGDFNVEIAYDELPSGVSEITIRATDNGGDVSSKSVQVEHVDTIVAPLPYSIDWSSVAEVSDVAQIVDGKWLFTSDGLRVLEPGYDQLPDHTMEHQGEDHGEAEDHENARDSRGIGKGPVQAAEGAQDPVHMTAQILPEVLGALIGKAQHEPQSPCQRTPLT